MKDLKIEKYTYFGVEYEDEFKFKRFGLQYMDVNDLLREVMRHGGQCPGRSEPLSQDDKFGLQCSCGTMFYMREHAYKKELLEKGLSIDDLDHKETLLCELMERDRPKTFKEKVWLKL